MPTFCAVVGCGTIGGKGISMFRFPSKIDNRGRTCPLREERLNKWIQALKREDLTEKKLKFERVCGKHFISGKKAPLHDKDHPDWIPSINMGHTSTFFPVSSSVKRYDRKKLREQKQEGAVCVEILEDTVSSSESGEEDPIEEQEVGEQDSLNVEEKLARALDQIETLKLQLKNYKYSEDNFAKDPSKCRYYTGLPNINYVNVVYNLIEEHIPDHAHSSLSKFERLALTLMKLRKDFDFIELGYKFDIHRTTASRIFHFCLFVLYKRLKGFIIWPNREILQKTMPQEFKEAFGNKVAIIIDCFEIFIERPSTLQARSQTFSHYKHHNTVKILVGITPQGSISFVSPSYGGRCSDKFIAENSKFLDNLLPGDAILADRGFFINDAVKLYHAEVIAPAYLKGKKQLHPVELEKTRKIAHLRINIERTIGNLRQKYEILSNKLSIKLLNDQSEVPIIDQIITVCCALINLCPPITN